MPNKFDNKVKCYDDLTWLDKEAIAEIAEDRSLNGKFHGASYWDANVGSLSRLARAGLAEEIEGHSGPEWRAVKNVTDRLRRMRYGGSR